MGAMPGRVGGKARKKLCASVTPLSRAVFNERATNESRLLYKKEQHGYNSHRIVCIRSRNCAATRLLGGYKMKCGTLAHPPDEAIRGWAKVRPFPFVSGILKRCFSWLEPENQSCSDSICNVLTLWSSSINVRHCTWLGFFLPPAVRDSGRKNHLGE